MSDAAAWIALSLTAVGLLGAFVAFGLSFFAPKETIKDLRADMDHLRAELNIQRQRLHALADDLLTEMHRKDRDWSE